MSNFRQSWNNTEFAYNGQSEGNPSEVWNFANKFRCVSSLDPPNFFIQWKVQQSSFKAPMNCVARLGPIWCTWFRSLFNWYQYPACLTCFFFCCVVCLGLSERCNVCIAYRSFMCRNFSHHDSSQPVWNSWTAVKNASLAISWLLGQHILDGRVRYCTVHNNAQHREEHWWMMANAPPCSLDPPHTVNNFTLISNFCPN